MALWCRGRESDMCAKVMDKSELKELLDEYELRYNCEGFVADDPISIAHSFGNQSDIEVAGLLVSLIAWGNRKMILRSGFSMMERMDNSPSDFVRGATLRELEVAARGFVHRTFNEQNFLDILQLLQQFLHKYDTLGSYFQQSYALKTQDLRNTVKEFRSELLGEKSTEMVARHISSIEKGSACKRLMMYMRWMVRSDSRGVDFGLWGDIPASALYIPLDVHSGRQGRELGLLTRKSDDWRAVEELTASLKEFDSEDPIRYDFALFGYGVNNKR